MTSTPRDPDSITEPVVGVSPGLYEFDPSAQVVLVYNSTGQNMYVTLNKGNVASETNYDIVIKNQGHQEIIEAQKEHIGDIIDISIWFPLGAQITPNTNFNIRGA